MTTSKQKLPANRLLAAISDRSRNDFLSGCDHIELGFGDTLFTSGKRISHIYLPTTGFISLITALDDGARLEVGMVGNEGMLGTSLLLGVDISPDHAIVQGAGTALRMSAAAFRRSCLQDDELHARLDRYLYVLMRQLAQTAACTRYHMIDARLARWLLMSRDRAHSDDFHLTHEFLAYMLGVRRVGVTEAAYTLQELGLIRYSRGNITLLDTVGLQRISCQCYARANRMYDQALGSTGRGRRVRFKA